MTAQEIFDKVSQHLLSQNCKSLGMRFGDTVCFYRGQDGRKCAIGVLIPDELYSSDFENLTIEELLVEEYFPAQLREELSPHKELLSELQLVHDNCRVNMWSLELRGIAKKHNLTCNF